MEYSSLIVILVTSLVSLPRSILSAPFQHQKVPDLCAEMTESGDLQLYKLCKLIVKCEYQMLLYMLRSFVSENFH
mgnify:CR=1 FL=1